MTRTTNRLTVVGVAVLTAALLLGVGALVGPGRDDAPMAGSTAATDATPVATPTASPTTGLVEPDVTATPSAGVPGTVGAVFDRVPDGVELQSQVGADGAEIEVTVDRSADAAWVLPTCTDGGPLPGAIDVLTTVETGPEYARYWQVAVLAGVGDAEAVFSSVAAAVEGCAAEVGAVSTAGAADRMTLGDLGAGDASLLAVARPAGTETSGQSGFFTYLGAVRVGNAVVLVAESAEFHETPTARDYGAQAVRADVDELLETMCATSSKPC